MAGLAQTKPVEAVASFIVIADVVHEVGGDQVHVNSLIGPNPSPKVRSSNEFDKQTYELL